MAVNDCMELLSPFCEIEEILCTDAAEESPVILDDRCNI